MAVDAKQIPAGTDWRLHLGWGVGTLGASFLLNAFAALQLFYMTEVLGVAIVTASGLLFTAKLWDWVSNPVMGMISDRTQSPWGRRRPYLLLGGVVAGLSFALFFNAEQLGIGHSNLLLVLTLMAVGTGYTIFNVPYMAMPSEMEDDYKVRTKMMSYRVFFIGIGTVIGTSSQRIAELFGPGAEGYGKMGQVLGFGIFFFMVLSFFGTTGARTLARQQESMSFFERLKTGLSNKPFAALLGTKFTQLFGLFTFTAMIAFVVKYLYAKEEPGMWILYYTATGTAVQILSIPAWLWIARRLEKRMSYVLATVIYCVVSLTWLWASPQEPLALFVLRAALKGFAAGGLLLMGQSMLPDTIEYDYRRTGLRREGIFSGLYSIVEKVASAFAPAILGLGYAFFGFTSKAPAQTQETIDGIRYCAAWLPTIYFGLSLIPLYFYRLTEKDLLATSRTTS